MHGPEAHAGGSGKHNPILDKTQYMPCCRLGNQSTATANHSPRVVYIHERSYPLDFIAAHQMWSTKHQYFACVMPKCGIRNWLHIILKQHLDDATFETIVSGGSAIFGFPWLPMAGWSQHMHPMMTHSTCIP